MKRPLKSLTAGALAFFARLVVRKYKPVVVMVTGSVGKTSTKDAVAAALTESLFVRASEKSYNSEFGVPLTILGAKNPWTSSFAWARVFKEALALVLLPNHYPKVLVLEVGADRPGDLARILRIATPDVVVVTRLPDVPVHVEAYISPDAVREEEFAPAYALAAGCPLIVSSDDPYAVEMAARLEVSTTTYGTDANANFRIVGEELITDEHKRVVGMQAVLRIGDARETLKVYGALGEQQLLPGAAALACAAALGVPLADALKGLSKYVPPPGRTRLLEGREGAVLIDDSYNASPAAVEEGLKALKLVHAKRHIAVLGDMMELGRYSVSEHERIGELAAKSADIVVAVGVRSRALAASARAAGLSEESVLLYDTAAAASAPLRALVGAGDAVLIKGSQSMRMERITEALLADPLDTSKLVRQEREWKRKN
jgi:UDP-N-acetylmuramoyl-tripeptide--D-alanyl-D-alanine ligase